MQKDLDVVNLVSTMRKLKAGLSAVIKNDKKLMLEAESIYLHDSLVDGFSGGKKKMARRKSVREDTN